MKDKVYQIIHTSGVTGKEETLSGTLDELKARFQAELKAAAKLNPKVKTDPKDVKQFVNALQKAYKVLEADQIRKTFIDIV